MANILSLALKINADASGLRLDPVERALGRLAAETDKVTAVFDRFTATSEVASREQERAAATLAELTRQRQAGSITAQEFAQRFEEVAVAARREAEELDRAARITEANRTAAERFATTEAELKRQLDAGRISQQTYDRAVAQAARSLTEAERAARGFGTVAADTNLKFNELSGILGQLPGPFGQIASRISSIASAAEGLGKIFRGGLSATTASLASNFAALSNPIVAATTAFIGLGSAATSLRPLVDSAVALGEEASKSGVIFEDAAGKVAQFAAAASAIGLSETQALQATGTFGNLFRAIGLSSDQAANFSVDLTRLASDLASFNNTTTSDAIFALSAALRGESEPIRRYGVLLNEATLKQVAFEEGITKTVRALEPAEKAQAAYAAIIRQTATAQGDFERTSDSLANLQRVLSATLTNVGTEIGQQLIPAFQAFTELAKSAAPLLQTLLESLAPLTSVISGVAQTVAAILRPLVELTNTVLKPLSGVILPAILAQLAFLNRGAIVAGVVGLARAFTAATAAAASYAGGATASALATQALGVAIRATINSTGVGLLVTTVGLAGGYLLEWATSAEAAAAETQAVGDAAAAAAGDVAGLRQELEDPLREGFAESFDRALENIRNSTEEVRRSAEGLTGDFARQARDTLGPLQSALAAYQRQLREADTTAEVERVSAAIERTTENYRRQIDVIKQAARERQQQIDTERKLAEAVIEQLRIQREFGGDERRARAAETVLAIEKEILRAEREVERLRFALNQEGLQAAETRLDSLREALKLEQQIALGIRQQAEADAQRIGRLEAAGRARADAEETILALQREQARVLEAGIFAADAASFDAAQRRIAELAELQKQQEALLFAQERGFAEGFGAAFEQVRDRFGELSEQAAEFGAVGQEAANRLRAGIAAAQEQARQGFLDRDAFEAEVAAHEQIFERELQNIRTVAEERRQINELVDQRLELARFGGDQQRLQAARTLAALEQEIGRVQADVRAARAAGDQQAVNAGVARIGQLDQIAAQERDIATGRAQIEEQIAQQRQAVFEQQQKLQEQARQAQAQALAEQQKAAAAEHQRQLARVRELNTLGAGVIQGNDLRTSEGAAQFLQLAAQRQDPALIEARLQTRRLTELRQEVRQLIERLTGLPVITLGGGVG